MADNEPGRNPISDLFVRRIVDNIVEQFRITGGHHGKPVPPSRQPQHGPGRPWPGTPPVARK